MPSLNDFFGFNRSFFTNHLKWDASFQQKPSWPADLPRDGLVCHQKVPISYWNVNVTFSLELHKSWLEIIIFTTQAKSECYYAHISENTEAPRTQGWVTWYRRIPHSYSAWISAFFSHSLLYGLVTSLLILCLPSLCWPLVLSGHQAVESPTGKKKKGEKDRRSPFEGFSQSPGTASCPKEGWDVSPSLRCWKPRRACSNTGRMPFLQ